MYLDVFLENIAISEDLKKEIITNDIFSFIKKNKKYQESFEKEYDLIYDMLSEENRKILDNLHENYKNIYQLMFSLYAKSNKNIYVNTGEIDFISRVNSLMQLISYNPSIVNIKISRSDEVKFKEIRKAQLTDLNTSKKLVQDFISSMKDELRKLENEIKNNELKEELRSVIYNTRYSLISEGVFFNNEYVVVLHEFLGDLIKLVFKIPFKFLIMPVGKVLYKFAVLASKTVYVITKPFVNAVNYLTRFWSVTIPSSITTMLQKIGIVKNPVVSFIVQNAITFALTSGAFFTLGKLFMIGGRTAQVSSFILSTLNAVSYLRTANDMAYTIKSFDTMLGALSVLTI